MVHNEQDSHRFASRVRNIACLMASVVALSLLTGCGAVVKEAYDKVTEEQAAGIQEGCVGDAVGLVHTLADRLAPLARANDVDEISRFAADMGCSLETTSDGYHLSCPAMELRDATLAPLLSDDGVIAEPRYSVSGTSSLRGSYR